MNILDFLIWILLIIILSFVLDLILRNIFRGYSYRIFLAPGVILHELAHAFACLLVLAKVKEISFFDKKGGFVKHEKSRFPFIGPVVISSAPLVIGIISVFILSKLLVSPTSMHLSFALNAQNIAKTFQAMLNINLFNLKNIIVFYFLLSISVTMTPSWQDTKNALVGFLFLLAIILGINYYFVIKVPETQVTLALGMVTCLLIAGILFSIILSLIKGIIKR